MLHRAYSLSSTTELFEKECENIRSIFHKLRYLSELIEATIRNFINTSDVESQSTSNNNKNTIRIVLPFIDQKPADIVKRQLTQLNKKLDKDLQPVFVNRKREDVLKFREPKPSLVSQQLVVYKFQCGSCDASYVGYTARHLHQRIEEHRYLAIGRHRLADHGQTTALPATRFSVIKKCAWKFDCLIHEMFYIKELKPSLNVQSDSVVLVL